MKRATIILLLLFLLLGCSTIDRPEIKASEPTAFPFELVKSSFKNNTSEMVDTVKPEPTESGFAHLSTSDEMLQRLNIVDPTNMAIRARVEILLRPNIVDPTDKTIHTEKEPLLFFATLVPIENEEVSPATIPLRCVYRNDKHFSLPKSRCMDDITDTGWLPPCRPIKAVPFRDIWLIGKKELRWLWGRGKE